MIQVWIDEFTPCLKDTQTGKLVQTKAIQITQKSFLKRYNRRNGWYTNWENLKDENEIYALMAEGTKDIQGLVALSRNDDLHAIYISWMCASPDNNKQIVEQVRYLGVGGHLFAIAAEKSIQLGYDGYMYGFAANKELLNHYVNTFHGEVIAMLHPYQFAIGEDEAKRIIEAYDYEWTDEKI